MTEDDTDDEYDEQELLVEFKRHGEKVYMKLQKRHGEKVYHLPDVKLDSSNSS
jgi:hypothetical protein